jgi:hypothetical protein
MSEQTLAERLNGRANGLCMYGIAPPRHSVSSDELRAIAMQQSERIRALGADGLIVYDIQDESDRTSAARPFPFLPTVDAGSYAFEQLRALEAPRIVYRNVSRDTPESFVRWLSSAMQRTASPVSVLVGAASRNSRPLLTLSQAYALRAQHAPNLLVGGVSIAERHARGADEHQRMLAKIESGCRFFVTQAVYDVTSAKSLLCDYALACAEHGMAPVPVLATFAPCGSAKTLAFMQWLGISFPRWLENDLRASNDPLQKSVALCQRIFEELWEYAQEKSIPLGVNIESVSIRRAEIEASLELFRCLRSRIKTSVQP